MADPGIFDSGYQQGFAVGSYPRLHQRALNDMEFQDRLGEIHNNIGTLQTKLTTLDPTTPDYLKAKSDLADAIQSRNDLYHPANNPGAIQKFGHLLVGKVENGLHIPQKPAPVAVAPPVYGQSTMDVDGKTIPAGPAYKVEGPQTPKQLKAQAEANQFVAPPSPSQAAVDKTKASFAGIREQVAQSQKLWDDNNQGATAEDREKAHQEIFDAAVLGYHRPYNTGRGNWELVSGTKDGKPFSYYHDKNSHRMTALDGTELDPGDLDGFIATAKNAPKPSQAWKNVYARAYARGHGITEDQLTTADMNFIDQQIALSNGVATTNILNTLKQDIYGRWTPIQESNRKIAGFGTILPDPRGDMSVQNKLPTSDPEAAAAAPAAGGAPAPASGQPAPAGGATTTAAPGNNPASGAAGTPPTPAQLKKEAAKRKPSGGTGAVRTGMGGVKVGEPILQGRTPNMDAAQKARDVAYGAYLDLDKAAQSGSPVDSQGIILAWLRGRVNRVTATEIQAVRNLGNLFEKFDGTVSSITRGTMTDEQMGWFVDSARQYYESQQQVVDQYGNPDMSKPPGPANAPNKGGFDWSTAVEHH